MLRVTVQPFSVFFSITVQRNHFKLRVITAPDIVNFNLNLGTSGSFSFGVINFLAGSHSGMVTPSNVQWIKTFNAHNLPLEGVMRLKQVLLDFSFRSIYIGWFSFLTTFFGPTIIKPWTIVHGFWPNFDFGQKGYHMKRHHKRNRMTQISVA